METKVKAHLLRIRLRAALAFCSCDGWTLQGISSELFAKKNHQHHIAGLPLAEKEGTK